MNKNRIILRLVTFVLTLLLAFYAVPVYAYASNSGDESSNPVCNEQKIEQNEEEQREDTTYDYEADGKIFNESTTTPVTGGYIRYTYDDYGRLVGKTHGARETGDSYDYTYVNEVEYSYRTFGEQSGYTDSLVTEYTTTVGTDEQTYTFEYDKAGNITKITRGGYELHYEYDDLNQLVKVTGNGWSEEYTYDNNGNILSVKKTDTASGTVEQNTYGYANTNWGDMLTSYNGVNMTYDAIGNPLSYYNGATFTWTGRRLTGATYGGNSYSFEYNDSGLRTSKTKNGSTVTYLYDGSLLISETTATYMIVYLYDVTGAPIGMQYREHTYGQYEWDVYYYRKNMQGDIIEVYSAAGTKLVSYSYDTWGNFTTVYYNGGASTAAALNPYTYRGYYYDSDLELYYLQSRYYDSNTGRFISPDGFITTGQGLTSYNMYAYCGNNPISRTDLTGAFWEKVGNFFSNAWNKIKTWAGNVFGAESSATATIAEVKTSIISEPSPITATTGTVTTQTISEHGDSSKFISVYADMDTSSPIVSSSAGLKINISEFTLDIGVGADNIGFSCSLTNGDVTNSLGFRLNLSEFKAGVEYSTALKWDSYTQTTYANGSISGWSIIALYSLLTTGQPVSSPVQSY